MADPAPSTALARVVQIAVLGNLHGQETVNNFYFANASAGAAPHRLHTAQAFDTEFMVNYVNRLSQDWTLSMIGVRVLTSPLLAPQAFLGLTNDQGLVASASLAPQIAVCMSSYTDHLGRRGRGRTFFPGIPTADVLAGKLTAAAKTAWDTLASTWDDDDLDIDGVGYFRIVFSPTSSNLATGVIYGSPVVTTIIREEICTLRRRKIGVGV